MLWALPCCEIVRYARLRPCQFMLWSIYSIQKKSRLSNKRPSWWALRPAGKCHCTTLQYCAHFQHSRPLVPLIFTVNA